MPPRKRQRVSQASTPQPKVPAEPTSPAPEAEADGDAERPVEKAKGKQKARDKERDAEKEQVPLPVDLWTNDEEIQLFKSLIKHKPTGTQNAPPPFSSLSDVRPGEKGIHKHFRMISIQEELRSHGYCGPGATHTRIPGIWDKLSSLYDLEILDERENNHIGVLATPSDSDAEAGSDGDKDGEEEAEGAEAEEEQAHDEEADPWRKRPFELPSGDGVGEELRDLAFARRVDESRESSPERIPGLSRMRNVLGDEELREKREELEAEMETAGTGPVRGRGRKMASMRGRGGRRGGRRDASTPAGSAREDEEAAASTPTAEESPQPKARRGKAASAAATGTRRSRRR